jgi:ribosomal protein L6P/L9E
MQLTFVPNLHNNISNFHFINMMSVTQNLNGFSLNIIYHINWLRHISSQLYIYMMGLIQGCTSYLELKGTGYKLKLIDSFNFFGLSLRIGYSNIIYLKLPVFCRVNFYQKSFVCLYTHCLTTLSNYTQSIFKQKKNNPYKVKGIFLKNIVVKIKKSTKLRF